MKATMKKVKLKPRSFMIVVFLLVIIVFFLFIAFKLLKPKLYFLKKNFEKLNLKFKPSNLTVVASLDNIKDGVVKLDVDELDMEDLIEDIHHPHGKNFDYLEPVLHNPSLCLLQKISKAPFVASKGWVPRPNTGQSIDSLIYVHTAVSNRRLRQVVRQTWGKNDIFKGEYSRVVFVLGAINEVKTQQQVDFEFRTYGDILQGNFMDTYKNITYKAVLSLRWVSKYCPGVKMVTKADDDSSLNVFGLKDYIFNNYHIFSKPALICNVNMAGTMLILRNKKNCMKWCVSKRDFPYEKTFPTYCSGLFYLMNMELVISLNHAINSTKFFWIDDVYVTGLLTQKVRNIGFHNATVEHDIKIAVKKIKRAGLVGVMAMHSKNTKNLSFFWNILIDTLSQKELERLNYKRSQLYINSLET